MRVLIFAVLILCAGIFVFSGCATTGEAENGENATEKEKQERPLTSPYTDFDGDGIPNRNDDDSDNDGFSDWLEEKHGTDPYNAFDHPEIKEAE